MKYYVLVLFAILFTNSIDAGRRRNYRRQQRTNACEIPENVTLSSSQNQFSGKFYKETAKQLPGKSIITSPISAHTLLSLLSLGSHGDAEKELRCTLGLHSANYTRTVFKPALEELRQLKGVTLKMANKIIVNKGKELNAKFTKDAVDVFDSAIDTLDFSDSQKSAQSINDWVESQTDHKIKNLVSPDSLSASTELVMINAIYFKGEWNNKFDRSLTTKQDFYITEDKKVQVDMMQLNKTNFYFANLQDWDAKMIELGYAGDEVMMYIILPNKIDGLSLVEEKISEPFDLENLLGNMHTPEVDLYLPRFRIESQIQLIPALTNMGIQRIFRPSNNLKDILKEGNIVVSDAIQKAFIDVNEDGAEASAASAIYVDRIASGTVVFRADHPFYFMIVSIKDYTVLFSGSVKQFD